jgi:hypothetical protein
VGERADRNRIVVLRVVVEDERVDLSLIEIFEADRTIPCIANWAGPVRSSCMFSTRMTTLGLASA